MTIVRDFGGVCWDGLWTLSFHLPRFHGHGFWLVCEVTISSVVVCYPLGFRAHFHVSGHSHESVVEFTNIIDEAFANIFKHFRKTQRGCEGA